jgi:hypothetical protein
MPAVLLDALREHLGLTGTEKGFDAAGRRVVDLSITIDMLL